MVDNNHSVPSWHIAMPPGGGVHSIGYFRGSELLFQDEIVGDLFTQVDRAMDLLYTKYTRGLVSYDGIYRVETFPVPREAMREAVINCGHPPRLREPHDDPDSGP